MSKKKAHHNHAHSHHTPSAMVQKPNGSNSNAHSIRNFLIGFFLVAILLVFLLFNLMVK